MTKKVVAYLMKGGNILFSWDGDIGYCGFQKYSSRRIPRKYVAAVYAAVGAGALLKCLPPAMQGYRIPRLSHRVYDVKEESYIKLITEEP